MKARGGRHQVIENWVLVSLSIVDLLFGILSLIFTQLEWQLCALISSCLTLIQVVRIMILYKNNIRAEILTLLLSIIDVATGVFSVLLFLYVMKAIAILLSSAKVFKVSKVAIQTSKALEFIKPVSKKVLPLVSTFFVRLLKLKPNIYKESKKMTKKDSFKDFIKNNPRTILGVVASVIASAFSGFGTSYGLILGKVQVPFWAEIVIGAVVFLAFAAISIIGVISSGYETNVKVALRKMASQLGYGNACESLEVALDQFNAELEKEKAQKEFEEEQAKAKYKAGFVSAVARGFVGSFDDYIAEQKQAELDAAAEAEKLAAEKAEQELKAQWVADIQAGATTLSFDAWKKTK